MQEGRRGDNKVRRSLWALRVGQGLKASQGEGAGSTQGAVNGSRELLPPWGGCMSPAEETEPGLGV